MKIKDITWLSSTSNTVGFIMTQNNIGETHLYVGSVDGINEEDDIKFILDWGSKIKPEYLINFINNANIKESK